MAANPSPSPNPYPSPNPNSNPTPIEQVMWQEQELSALAGKLQQAEWEARSYADKEAPLQAQAQQACEL